MRKKLFDVRWALALAGILLVSPAFRLLTAGGSETSDPVHEYARRIGQVLDPHNASDREILASLRLIRFVADFNGDGLADVALSNSLGWGNAGGEWDLYLQVKGGRYAQCRQPIFFHPLAIHLAALKGGGVRLTVYSRLDARSGSLVEYRLNGCDRALQGRRRVRPQDDRGDEMEYQRLFGPLRKKPLSEYCLLAEFLADKGCAWKKGY